MEPDRLFDCLPSTLRPSSESQPDGGKNPSTGSQSENQQNSEAAVYSPPTLIEPKFVPLLSKLAQQLVQAGCQQQCSEIYRYEDLQWKPCSHLFLFDRVHLLRDAVIVTLYGVTCWDIFSLACSEARASALESSLKNLGVEKLSKDEVQKMPWEILESKIGNWIHFMRIAVRNIFLSYLLLWCSIPLVTFASANRSNFFLLVSASFATKFLNAVNLWGISASLQ